MSASIAELEAISDAAVAAHDKALARLVAIDEIIAAFDLISDRAFDVLELSDSDRAAIKACDGRALAANTLRAHRSALKVEIDALETECHRTAKDLNDAPDEVTS